MRYQITILLLFSSFCAAQTIEADGIVGEWWTQEKDAKFLIQKTDTSYEGKISWLKKPTDDNGNPVTDENNQDPALRKQPILGATLLRRFKYIGDNQWANGHIYNPR